MLSWLANIADLHPVVAGATFIVARALAIIIPPIPGAVLDIPAVKIFGWKLAFVLSEMGTMLGAMVTFGLARRAKRSNLGTRAIKFLRIDKVHEWESRLPPNDQFLAWIALRLPTNGAFDYISYAAGLTNCPPWMFFWSTLIGNVPVVFAFFLLAGIGFEHNSLAGWLLPLVFLCFISIPVGAYIRKKLGGP